jgi:2-succinyl-6-hydroxy-2,4-cyclohexadiene-1-carboxylate synthase
MSTLVLLHGFLGAPSAWGNVIAHLVPSPRAIVALSLVGHGAPAHDFTGDLTLDPARDDPAPFEHEVDRVAAQIQTLGATSESGVHLCGYSLGGRVALGIAVRHPRLVRRLTLVGAAPGLAESEARAARRVADEAWAKLLDEGDLTRFLERWEEQPIFSTQRALPDDVLRAQRALRAHHAPRALATAMRILSLGRMPDRGPSLGALAMPVDLVVGARDEKFTALAREMARVIPHGALEVVPDVGHNVTLEAPQRFAEILSRDSRDQAPEK